MDKDLSMEEWADMIDEARGRQAYGDLSVIAYRLLTVKTLTKGANMSNPTKDVVKESMVDAINRVHLGQWLRLQKKCKEDGKEPHEALIDALDLYLSQDQIKL